MQKRYDVIVAGGGFTGVCAAIGAAREGKKVLIIDRNNCFGGAATECLVNPFMGFYVDREDGVREYLSRGIFGEIIDNLRAADAIDRIDRTFDEEYLKVLLNRMVLKEGIDILFNSYLTDAEVTEGKVESITVSNKSGRQTWQADYFVDATGDGDLAVLCGCDYQLGRIEDSLCQPMTLCFRMANVDLESFQEEKAEIQKLYNEWQAEGKIQNPRENVLTFANVHDGVLHFNSTRIVKRNPTDALDVTRAEIEAREQTYELCHFLKNHFKAFANAKLLITAPRIGVRESRMIEGEYQLNKEDILEGIKFEDGIAACRYNMDIHNPDGGGTTHYYIKKKGDYYTVPYRCLTPKKTVNLLVAGRCISSTHEAQASYRIMPVCANIGEAAGIAAAIAHENGCGVKDISTVELRKRIVARGGRVD